MQIRAHEGRDAKSEQAAETAMPICRDSSTAQGVLHGVVQEECAFRDVQSHVPGLPPAPLGSERRASEVSGAATRPLPDRPAMSLWGQTLVRLGAPSQQFTNRPRVDHPSWIQP
jgi:hypothetical protein